MKEVITREVDVRVSGEWSPCKRQIISVDDNGEATLTFVTVSDDVVVRIHRADLAHILSLVC